MPPLAGEQALGLLATMWRIRVFEERVGRLTRDGEVHGLIHLSTGQEGVAVGVCAQLRDDDAVYSGSSGTRPRDREGRAARSDDGGADGARRRALPGARRLDASGRRRARLHGGDRRRRRHDPDRARERARGTAARRRCGGGRLLRRRGRAGGPLQRDRQPRVALEAAADPGVREQRLRRVHAALGAHGRRAGERRRRAVRDRAGHGRRERRARRVGHLRALSRRSSCRRRPVPARMPDLPPRRALRGRSGQVPRGDRRCRVAGEGSDPAACSATGWRRGGAPRTSSRRPRGGGSSPRSSRRSSSGATARSHRSG